MRPAADGASLPGAARVDGPTRPVARGSAGRGAGARGDGRVIPDLFIVGAPRCGTSSLHAYLAAHPRVFMSRPKEPHHFGSDLEIRSRPYASLDAYLDLFAGAREAEHAGEASVLYLYSRAAPAEILALSPAARIVVMLRDPVEFIESLHAHNLLQGYEDIRHLEGALAAEEDRREGRRIPAGCIPPLCLQYTTLVRYARHVARYREAFGPERVLCLLLEDLREDPERTCERVLSFLELDGVAVPPARRENARKRWRSPATGRALLSAYRRAAVLGLRVPWRVVRVPLLVVIGAAFYAPLRLNVTAARPVSTPPELRRALREGVRDDVRELGEMLGRDLSGWSDPPSEAEKGRGR